MESRIQCPACGSQQDKAPECRDCGVVFARFGEARSLFTARRTGPRRGPLVVRSAPRPRPSWPLVAAALTLGLGLGWALRGPPSETAPALTPTADVVAVAPPARDETPLILPRPAPGLRAAQLGYGDELVSWRADGAEPPVAELEPAQEPELEPERLKAPEPQSERAEETQPPSTPAVDDPAPGRGASLVGSAGASRNERYDPVGSRGWYAGFAGYERALDERDRTGKTLVVYFHASWCTWCARFRGEYLSSKPMRRFLDDVIRVHIDPEAGDAEADLSTFFGVQAVPSFFVVPAGTERPERLHPFLGDVELDPETFARLCEHVARGGAYPEPRSLGAGGVVPWSFEG